MCLNPQKCAPKRYIGYTYLKNKVIDTIKYDGQIYRGSDRYIYYPCGQCYECREKKIEEWQIRWREQLLTSVDNTSYMLTLTYNDANLPYIDTPYGKKSTLYYRHVQLFLKRLRKYQEKYCKKNNIPNEKISYHGSGEYGPKFTKRPHYHILVTNVLFPKELIEKIWSYGHVHIGDKVDQNTIKYVLKYTLKHGLTQQRKHKLYSSSGAIYTTDGEILQVSGFKPNPKNEATYVTTLISSNQKNSYRVAEKTFLSKGIGKNFLTPEKIKYYEENPTGTYFWENYTKSGQPKQKPLPRYYKEAIFNPNIIENGRILRDDHYRPVKKYNPLDENFESTPRFKRLLASFKKQQHQLLLMQKQIQIHGYEKYIQLKSNSNKLKRKNYQTELIKREQLQQHKNEINMVLNC